MKQPCVYILSNKKHGTLYIGVSSDLIARVWQHKNAAIAGFTSRYGVSLLVWYEATENMVSAIAREKQLKAGSRARKISLIETNNPEWLDLYPELL